jgi:glycine/D-amino acid oxidase-like deaminating enzyme
MADMKNRIYWLEHLPAAPVIPVEPFSNRCDVAIVGGGFTGLSTALHLARRGLAVSIFENNTAGSGASTRNAGMTLAGLKLSPQALIGRYGKAQAIRLYRASLAAIEFTERLIHQEGIQCEFLRCGAIWAAYAQRHRRELNAVRQLLNDTFNHETWTVDGRAMQTELDSPYYCGGLVDPLSAGVQPAKLIHGLLKSALTAGVRICEHTPVTAVTACSGHYQLKTPRGMVRAEKVIVATNGYTPSFFKFLRRRVIPIGSYIIVTEPLPPDIAPQLIPQGRMVFDTKHLLYYFRMVEGNRLLFGGRVSFGQMDDRSAAEKLQQEMHQVFPQLKPFQTEFYWSGNVCFTFDQMPHLGQDNGIYYALGYCGHGVAMSIYAGYTLAEMIAGEAVDNPFTELAFKSRFYYRQKPWFLPLAGAYYRMIDRLER